MATRVRLAAWKRTLFLYIFALSSLLGVFITALTENLLGGWSLLIGIYVWGAALLAVWGVISLALGYFGPSDDSPVASWVYLLILGLALVWPIALIVGLILKWQPRKRLTEEN